MTYGYGLTPINNATPCLTVVGLTGAATCACAGSDRPRGSVCEIVSSCVCHTSMVKVSVLLLSGRQQSLTISLSTLIRTWTPRLSSELSTSRVAFAAAARPTWRPTVSPKAKAPATAPTNTLFHGSTCCHTLSAGFGFGGGVPAGAGSGPGDSDGAGESPGGGRVVCLYAK